jgi:L-lactate dehydrogenase (cytochrome)
VKYSDLAEHRNDNLQWTKSIGSPKVSYGLSFKCHSDDRVVSKHNSPKSCWVILYDKVYNVTSLLESHPGGPTAILRLAGKDATSEFDAIHPKNTLDQLPSDACLGRIDISTLPVQVKKLTPDVETEPFVHPADVPHRPKNISQCLSLKDIEYLATTKLSPRAWSYYYSAGDDLVSKSLNTTVYSQILLRPRALIDVTQCNLTTSLLKGRIPLKFPMFISPAAQARLGHPTGEAGIGRACEKMGALQIVSYNASMTAEEVLDGAPGVIIGAQIYVQTDRAKSEAWLKRIAALYHEGKVHFICLTVDAHVAGKREHDERMNFAQDEISDSVNTTDDSPSARVMRVKGSVGKALFAGTAMNLTWRETVEWISRIAPGVPLVIKGLQAHEDAYIASKFPQIAGIMLSNHGGRELDTAPPCVHTLLEIRKYCPEVFEKLDVWVDGGIMRGTDVIKALCLGAKAVGIGRAALYGLAAGGPEGVERVLRILKDEMKTCMRLLGCTSLKDLGMQNVGVDLSRGETY